MVKLFVGWGVALCAHSACRYASQVGSRIANPKAKALAFQDLDGMTEVVPFPF
jgi:hypothetical protein